MEDDRKTVNVLYAKQVLRASERAMGRAASLAHEDLKHGLNTLATNTCIATFAGILGTVWAIAFDTFLGFDGPRSTGLALVAEGISRACVPAAFGIVVGLQSLWAYRYLRNRLTDFDREMANASLSLVNQLALHLDRLRSAEPMQEALQAI
jgi:biopolymer transport protein ExbB/TolQ